MHFSGAIAAGRLKLLRFSFPAFKSLGGVPERGEVTEKPMLETTSWAGLGLTSAMAGPSRCPPSQASVPPGNISLLANRSTTS